MMNKILDYFFRYFNYLFALVVAAMYTNALVFPNMGIDASFYFRVTECILEGAIPEHDLRIMYPPLIFYMLLPVKLIVGKAVAYELFLGYMFIIQGINAYLIYKISGKYSENNFIRVFASLLYLLLSIKLEGEYFFLEPFINLWGLLALWVYLARGRNNMIWLGFSGLLAILAFLIKQYGLAYAGFIGILIFIDEWPSFRTILTKGLIFLAGFIGGLVIFIAVFRFGYGVYYDFFAGGRLGLYGEKDTQALISGLFKYIFIAPYLLLLFLPSVLRKLIKTKTHFLAYLFLLILFSAQLYLQQYDHYYILMLPPLLFMGVIIYGKSRKLNKSVVLLVVLLSLFVNEVFIGPRTKSLILSKRSSLQEEVALARDISNIIPPDSKVYIFSDVKLYYLCHFKPVIPEKYGFSWYHMTSLRDLDDILSEGEYVIIDHRAWQSSIPLIDGIIIPSEVIESFNFKLFSTKENHYIFRK